MKKIVTLGMAAGLCLLLSTIPSRASDLGSDALLDTFTLGAKPKSEVAAAGEEILDAQLSNPFQREFYVAWRSQPALPFEVNSWARLVLKGEFAKAAHLKTIVMAKTNGAFETAITAAHLYCLWHLNLPQTFLNQWLAATESPSYQTSRIAQSLNETIAPQWEEFLASNSIHLSPQQAAQVDKSDGLVFRTLKALNALRGGANGIAILQTLPVDHPLKVALAQTVALALIRKNDIGGAAKILKLYLEPALQAQNDPKLLAQHYLEIARLLYQTGSLEGAEKFYDKIPNSTPEFLPAREELAWVWLRTGNMTRLRGELATLTSPVFAGRFSPEVYLVRAISNLKLCFYDQVEKNLTEFVAENRKWAQEITNALAAELPPAPVPLDFYSHRLETAYENRLTESSRLDELWKESINAQVPAVGPQAHWQIARDRLASDIENLKKDKAKEFRRQWKNQDRLLAEAIRKMKFVKVELLSQVAMLSNGQKLAEPSDKATMSRLAKSTLDREKGKLNFPFDGVYWPDEFFHMRSVAQASCLKAKQ